ncbi:AURKA kinase, partial [Alaudala cheleensis]|nr:AURKA kinase [Alaudala cheleensis]
SSKVANPLGDVPKRVPVSQHSAQSRLLTSGAPARVLCPANFAQRVPVQSQKPALSAQKLSNNQTTQQPRPKVSQQATVRAQAASKSTEKPPQAAAPGKS